MNAPYTLIQPPGRLPLRELQAKATTKATDQNAATCEPLLAENPSHVLSTDIISHCTRNAATSVNGTGHTGKDPTQASNDNRDAMKDIYVNGSINGGNGLLALAQPENSGLARRVDNLAQTFVEQVQAWKDGRDIPDFTHALYPAYQAFEQGVLSGNNHAGVKYWLSGKKYGKETDMYPSLVSFFCLVAHFVKHAASHDLPEALRLILPFKNTNKKPEGTLSTGMVDIALATYPIDASVKVQPEGLDYGLIFAILEAKVVGEGSLTAAKEAGGVQLFDYTRNSYEARPDRRFAWGLICADTAVWASLMSHHKAHESDMMDVMTEDGLYNLARLVMGWSFCSWRQLGYDETFAWSSELNCYVIKVPTGQPGEFKDYYSNEVLMNAERLFGRHCRCMAGSATKPIGRVSKENPIRRDVVIKDTWVRYIDCDAEAAGVDSQHACRLAADMDRNASEVGHVAARTADAAGLAAKVAQRLGVATVTDSALAETVKSALGNVANIAPATAAHANKEASQVYAAGSTKARPGASTVIAKTAATTPTRDAVTAIVDVVTAAARTAISNISDTNAKMSVAEAASVVADAAFASASAANTATAAAASVTPASTRKSKAVAPAALAAITAASAAGGAATVAAAVAAGLPVAEAVESMVYAAVAAAMAIVRYKTRAAPFIWLNGQCKPQVGTATVAAAIGAAVGVAMVAKAAAIDSPDDVADQLTKTHIGDQTGGGPMAANRAVFGWPQPNFDPNDKPSRSLLRDECEMLRRIKMKLGDSSNLDYRYSEIECGGWVFLPRRSDASTTPPALVCGEHILSSTPEIIGQLDPHCLHYVPWYAQQRMAISPIGESIYTAQSVGELIRVLYGVMCCYMDAYRKCGITHRDISDNNILIIRINGVAYGLLIDYGCSYDKNAESSTQPMSTGTFPFMSISNLEVSDAERTILDDWESLLYLICVLATTGINRQRKNAEIAGLDILGWFNGSAAKVANTKRGHMHSADNFCNHITEHFYDDGDDGSTLADLAEELRECLFNNKQLQSVKCRQGAYKYTDKCTKQRVDPLKPRAKYADVIGDQLLAILERFVSETSA